jgi:predicted signal transduction protein with EAL and GGDEF domain
MRVPYALFLVCACAVSAAAEDPFPAANALLPQHEHSAASGPAFGRSTACIRRTDTVSRLGGDEFLILLSQVECAEDAAVTARKILRAIASPHIIDNKSLDINVSIGGSTYPADGQDAASLVSQADVAMYEAKQHGRNSYQSFRKDMNTRLAKRVLLESDLRLALGRKEFLLHYQPKIDLQTGLVTGMETLLRWQHPERGMLLPATFVAIAEE